jgi:non-canonical (house-cleaning) NTP pyrophosphatase
MDGYTIALGTISELELKYLNEILNELNINYFVVSVEVDSLVSNQPISSDETKKGSLNRARHAFRIAKEHGEGEILGIGIEVGYEKNRLGRYEVLSWASIVDGRGREISKNLIRFRSLFFNHALESGEHISDYVDEYVSNRKTGEKNSCPSYQRPTSVYHGRNQGCISSPFITWQKNSLEASIYYWLIVWLLVE